MIKAKIIKDSISPVGKRITTFELEYPRFIHAELLTHRTMSRNSSSSRAITHKSMLEQVKKYMAMPIHWGKHQKGMGASEELEGLPLWLSKKMWIWCGYIVTMFAWGFWKLGLAKQIANRILEPWSHIKIVLTSTEFDNFFHLRNHPDAQPEIHELARLMWGLYRNNVPTPLEYGEWHLPYVSSSRGSDNELRYFTIGRLLNLEEAKKVSASICAQISYRTEDCTLERAERIYQRMAESQPVHASPFEHQATPLPDPDMQSGNFRGWRQYRQDIPNNVCFSYLDPMDEKI